MTSDAVARGLHRASPGANVLLLIVMAGAVLASPSLPVRACVIGLLVVLAIWSRVAVRGLVTSLRFVLVFALILFVAQALSIREGAAVLRVPIAVTVGGLEAGAAMALRFLAILAASFLFIHVTDPDRLAGSLIRWGVPYRYGYLLILALRFVPFFRRELRIVREAQRMRGIRTSVRSLAGIRSAVRYTFVPVLVSGLMRVDSIAMSMKGRCFGLHSKRTRTAASRLGPADAVVVAICAGLIAATVITRGGG